MADIDGETKSTEVKTPGTRRNQETSEYGLDRNQHSGVGCAGSKTRSESIPTNRADRSWGNPSRQCEQRTIGGIFERLIAKTHNQIQETEKLVTDLKKELEDLKILFRQFKQDNESEQ